MSSRIMSKAMSSMPSMHIWDHIELSDDWDWMPQTSEINPDPLLYSPTCNAPEPALSFNQLFSAQSFIGDRLELGGCIEEHVKSCPRDNGYGGLTQISGSKSISLPFTTKNYPQEQSRVLLRLEQPRHTLKFTTYYLKPKNPRFNYPPRCPDSPSVSDTEDDSEDEYITGKHNVRSELDDPLEPRELLKKELDELVDIEPAKENVPLCQVSNKRVYPPNLNIAIKHQLQRFASLNEGNIGIAEAKSRNFTRLPTPIASPTSLSHLRTIQLRDETPIVSDDTATLSVEPISSPPTTPIPENSNEFFTEPSASEDDLMAAENLPKKRKNSSNSFLPQNKQRKLTPRRSTRTSKKNYSEFDGSKLSVPLSAAMPTCTSNHPFIKITFKSPRLPSTRLQENPGSSGKQSTFTYRYGTRSTTASNSFSLSSPPTTPQTNQRQFQTYTKEVGINSSIGKVISSDNRNVDTAVNPQKFLPDSMKIGLSECYGDEFQIPVSLDVPTSDTHKLEETLAHPVVLDEELHFPFGFPHMAYSPYFSSSSTPNSIQNHPPKVQEAIKLIESMSLPYHLLLSNFPVRLLKVARHSFSQLPSFQLCENHNSGTQKPISDLSLSDGTESMIPIDLSYNSSCRTSHSCETRQSLPSRLSDSPHRPYKSIRRYPTSIKERFVGRSYQTRRSLKQLKNLGMEDEEFVDVVGV